MRWPSLSGYQLKWRGLPMVTVGMLMLTFAAYNLRLHPAIVGCPLLKSHGRSGDRQIGTLAEAWPDRSWGIQSAYPAVYATRASARHKYGPLFWTVDHDLGTCFLTIIDKQLAASVFERDGTELGRSIDVTPRVPAAYKGVKFSTGADWSRQRAVLAQGVLTLQNKRALAEAATPSASRCMLHWLEQASRSSTSVDLLPMVRECIGRFFVHTVLGAHFADHDKLVAKLLDCEQESCGQRHSMFDCLTASVRQESARRHAAATADPDGESLLSRMLKFVGPDGTRIGEFLSLSLDEAASNAISFMAAGWETAVVTMLNALWALSSLSKGNQLQQKMRSQEGADAEGLGLQIVSETLRWRPPVLWHAGNVVQDQMEISLEQPDGQTHTLSLPHGTRLLVDILGTNELSASGVEDGWDPENTDEEHASGIGARHCPGGMLGRWGVAWMLADLLKRYQFRLVYPGSRDQWLRAFTGDFDHDLCALTFDTPLEVNVDTI